MGRDTITLEQAVSTISQEYLQLFCLDYFIPESLHPELPGPEDTIPLDSLKNWNNRFFWVDERVFPTLVAWRSSAPRDNKPIADSYSEADVATLDTHRTSFGQQPEDLLCLVGISRNYFFPEDQYPVFLYDNDQSRSSKATAVEDEDTDKSSSFISMGGPPDDIYQPNWGITNRCRLDNPLVHQKVFCQELVDHIIPPGCFLEMRHLPSEDFLSQYNINMARQVALGSQLRLRFEQESKLLKRSVAKIGRREQKIQVQDDKIRNLESLIEAESDMKRAAKAKNETLTKELEDLRAHFSKLQVDSEQLTQQVVTLQA
ncbi:hypothetical protein Tco_1034485 [Tanacetum coccineum]